MLQVELSRLFQVDSQVYPLLVCNTTGSCDVLMCC